MPIPTSCPACGHVNHVAVNEAGQSVRCYLCDESYTAPQPPARITRRVRDADTTTRRRSAWRGDQVAVPRRVLYLQGAITLGLAIASFILGAVFGAGPAGQTGAMPTPAASSMPDRTLQVRPPAQAMISRFR